MASAFATALTPLQTSVAVGDDREGGGTEIVRNGLYGLKLVVSKRGDNVTCPQSVQ